jgi:hypothetical protein
LVRASLHHRFVYAIEYTKRRNSEEEEEKKKEEEKEEGGRGGGGGAEMESLFLAVALACETLSG